MAGEQVSTGPYTPDGSINPLYNRGLPAYKVAPPRDLRDERRELAVRTAIATLAVVFTLSAVGIAYLGMLLLFSALV